MSLSLLYGFRLWSPLATAGVLAATVVITGTAIVLSAASGHESFHELAEVPLMGAMFAAMVWHARRRQTALARVERAAEREREFVRDASHHLRTPIAVARGYTELIRDGADDEQVIEDAGVVLDELGRLARMSERLLILAAAEHQDFLLRVPVELGELVSTTAKRWSVVADRDWEAGTVGQGYVLCDQERLDCALDALIENAVKATQPGDRITVAARATGYAALIEVGDSGKGIAPERLGRIFNRFDRAPGRQGEGAGGTGLGLPIVRAVAEAHGGTVSVRSELAMGTTFELRLPLAALARSEDRSGSVRLVAAGGGGRA